MHVCLLVFMAGLVAACRITTPDFDPLEVDGGLPDHCSDREQNAGETDIDCGGPCEGCAVEQRCQIHSDCQACLACATPDGRCRPVADRTPCGVAYACDDGDLAGE
jgi:hypothetical protein